jgi:hypothetical protein
MQFFVPWLQKQLVRLFNTISSKASEHQTSRLFLIREIESNAFFAYDDQMITGTRAANVQ